MPTIRNREEAGVLSIFNQGLPVPSHHDLNLYHRGLHTANCERKATRELGDETGGYPNDILNTLQSPRELIRQQLFSGKYGTTPAQYGPYNRYAA